MTDERRARYSFTPTPERTDSAIGRREFLRDTTLLGMSTAAAYAFSGKLAGGNFTASAHAQTTPAVSTLRVVPLNELKLIDPIWTTAYTTRDHGYMIYDTLLATDVNFVPQPQMADSWTVSSDQLTWTFVLRDGLAWHDGTPVTAEDCVASLRRWAARDTQGQILLERGANITASDDKTIVIELTKPFGMMLEALAKQTSLPAFMMPKRVAETDPFEAIDDTTGSGPFIFKRDEWVLGSRTVYVRNPNYVPRAEPPSGTAGGKIAKVERVEWRSLPDAGTALNALQQGEIDYWLSPEADLVGVLQGNPEVVVKVNDPIGWLNFLRLNHVVGPTSNKKIRQAILAAVDQEEFMLAAVGNPEYFRTSYSVYPSGSPWATEAGNERAKEHGIEEAKALLEEAGYNGEKVAILQAVDTIANSTMGLIAAETLKRIGMNVELRAMDYQTLVATRSSKAPIEEGGWSMFATRGIALDYLSPFSVLLSGAGEKGWVGWVDEPRIEELKLRFAEEADMEKRKAIASEIQVLAYEAVSYIPLGISRQPIAYRKRVSGILPSALNLYWNISVQ